MVSTQETSVTSSQDSFNPAEAPKKKTDGGDEIDPDGSKPTAEDLFPWLIEFKKKCRCLLAQRSMASLVRLMKFYARNVSINVNECYTKPYRAAKLKDLISETLLFFLFYYRELVEGNDRTVYLDKMSDLLAMYMDMELKASRRGKEHHSIIAARLTSCMYVYLENSAEHFLDTLIKARFISRNYRDILDPVITKIFKSISVEPNSDIMYIRCLLAYRLWKKVNVDAAVKNQINMTAISRLGLPPASPPPFLRKYVLPKVPKSQTNSTKFLLLHKFDIEKSCRLFVQYCKENREDKSQGELDKMNFIAQAANADTLEALGGSDMCSGTIRIDNCANTVALSTPEQNEQTVPDTLNLSPTSVRLMEKVTTQPLKQVPNPQADAAALPKSIKPARIFPRLKPKKNGEILFIDLTTNEITEKVIRKKKHKKLAWLKDAKKRINTKLVKAARKKERKKTNVDANNSSDTVTTSTTHVDSTCIFEPLSPITSSETTYLATPLTTPVLVESISIATMPEPSDCATSELETDNVGSSISLTHETSTVSTVVETIPTVTYNAVCNTKSQVEASNALNNISELYDSDSAMGTSSDENVDNSSPKSSLSAEKSNSIDIKPAPAIFIEQITADTNSADDKAVTVGKIEELSDNNETRNKLSERSSSALILDRVGLQIQSVDVRYITNNLNLNVDDPCPNQDSVDTTVQGMLGKIAYSPELRTIDDLSFKHSTSGISCATKPLKIHFKDEVHSTVHSMETNDTKNTFKGVLPRSNSDNMFELKSEEEQPQDKIESSIYYSETPELQLMKGDEKSNTGGNKLFSKQMENGETCETEQKNSLVFIDEHQQEDQDREQCQLQVTNVECASDVNDNEYCEVLTPNESVVCDRSNALVVKDLRELQDDGDFSQDTISVNWVENNDKLNDQESRELAEAVQPVEFVLERSRNQELTTQKSVDIDIRQNITSTTIQHIEDNVSRTSNEDDAADDNGRVQITIPHAELSANIDGLSLLASVSQQVAQLKAVPKPEDTAGKAAFFQDTVKVFSSPRNMFRHRSTIEEVGTDDSLEPMSHVNENPSIEIINQIVGIAPEVMLEPEVHCTNTCRASPDTTEEESLNIVPLIMETTVGLDTCMLQNNFIAMDKAAQVLKENVNVILNGETVVLLQKSPNSNLYIINKAAVERKTGESSDDEENRTTIDEKEEDSPSIESFSSSELLDIINHIPTDLDLSQYGRERQDMVDTSHQSDMSVFKRLREVKDEPDNDSDLESCYENPALIRRFKSIYKLNSHVQQSEREVTKDDSRDEWSNDYCTIARYTDTPESVIELDPVKKNPPPIIRLTDTPVNTQSLIRQPVHHESSSLKIAETKTLINNRRNTTGVLKENSTYKRNIKQEPETWFSNVPINEASNHHSQITHTNLNLHSWNPHNGKIQQIPLAHNNSSPVYNAVTAPSNMYIPHAKHGTQAPCDLQVSSSLSLNSISRPRSSCGRPHCSCFNCTYDMITHCRQYTHPSYPEASSYILPQTSPTPENEQKPNEAELTKLPDSHVLHTIEHSNIDKKPEIKYLPETKYRPEMKYRPGMETKLPLKKRLKAYAMMMSYEEAPIKIETVENYPSTLMMSIADLEAQSALRTRNSSRERKSSHLIAPESSPKSKEESLGHHNTTEMIRRDYRKYSLHSSNSINSHGNEKPKKHQRTFKTPAQRKEIVTSSPFSKRPASTAAQSKPPKKAKKVQSTRQTRSSKRNVPKVNYSCQDVDPEWNPSGESKRKRKTISR